MHMLTQVVHVLLVQMVCASRADHVRIYKYRGGLDGIDV